MIYCINLFIVENSVIAGAHVEVFCASCCFCSNDILQNLAEVSGHKAACFCCYRFCFLIFIFKTGWYCATALAGLEFTMQTRLTFNSVHLPLILSARTIGVRHCTQLRQHAYSSVPLQSCSPSFFALPTPSLYFIFIILSFQYDSVN